jgi:TP901-1 family phage major tail protein
MGAVKGRAVQVFRNSVLVAGARTKSLTINGSPIDVTTDDDDGVRKLLDQPGQIDVEITVAGVLVSDALRAEALSSSDRTQTTDFVIQGWAGSPDHTKLSGSFFLSSYKESGEYQGSATFEATFVSAGAVTLS